MKHLVHLYCNNGSGELQTGDGYRLQGSHSGFAKKEGNINPVLNVLYPQVSSHTISILARIVKVMQLGADNPPKSFKLHTSVGL